MVLKNFLQVYRVLYCRSALHMVGVGNQASSPSSKNTLHTICTSTKVEIFLLVPGPGIREPPLATRLGIHNCNASASSVMDCNQELCEMCISK